MTDAARSNERGGIGRRTSRSLRWTLLGTIGANLIRLAAIPVLGRLLSPAEFGLVAAGLTVITFAQMVKDVGIGAALVQRESIADAHVAAGVGFSIVLGFALGALVVAAAPLVAAFYDLPELTPIVQALALLFVLRGFASVSRALCQREMRYRALSLIDLGSYASGTATTIACAAAGAGAWSLVIGYLVETAVASTATIAVRPLRPRLGFARAPVRELLRFGAGSTLADVAAFSANQGDYIVVGAMLGSPQLGLYTRAYELMRFPSAVFTNVAGSVLFSAFSRLQTDPERLGRAFRRGTFALAAILIPASVGLVVLAPEMIAVLLGPGWSEAVLPFQILAVSMFARTAYKLGGGLARASGLVYRVAVANLVYGVMVIAGAAVGSRWGIAGVAVAITIVCTLQYVVLSSLGLARTTLGWRELARPLVEAAVAAAAVLAAVAPVVRGLRSIHAHDAVVLVAAFAVGLVAVALVAIAGIRRGQQDWCWAWDAIRRRSARGGR